MKYVSKRKILLTIIFSSAVLFWAGCSCSNASSKQDETEIPKDIINKANKIISEKTGEEYFTKYISPDYSKSKKIGSNYYLVYRFVMPDKKYVDEEITMSVDSLGNPIEGTPIQGIPNCRTAGDNCSFRIDEAAAMKIAEDNNLEKGIKPWKTDFRWDAELEKYVWSIRTVFSESESSQGYRGSGKEMLIDPNTGAVISTEEWHVR